ncbi:hypothetical protein Esti_000641 [Eimeria stiedai]
MRQRDAGACLVLLLVLCRCCGAARGDTGGEKAWDRSTPGKKVSFFEWTGKEEQGRLQQLLTDYCVEKCKFVDSEEELVCSDSVARYLPYKHHQQRGWHCYPAEALSQVGAFLCVNDCGEPFPCGGSSGPHTVLAWGDSREMKELLRVNRYRWCQYTSCTQHAQSLLDSYCKETLHFACDPNSPSCAGGAKARKDVGDYPEAGKAWRCYAPSALSSDVNTAECLEGCKSEPVSCGDGVKGGVSSRHWDLGSALEKLIAKKTANEAAQASSSKLQQLLDEACTAALVGLCNPSSSSCLGGAKARNDVASVDDDDPRWRCYNPIALRRDLYSALCITDCGDEVPCGDGVDLSVANAYFDQFDVGTKIEMLRQTTCNPAVAGHLAPPISSLQRRLDEYCKEQLKDVCQGDLCPSGAVARKEVGDITQQTQQWRCYNHTQLTTSAGTAICVTDCGTEAPCGDGIVTGGSHSHWTRSEELESLIEQHKDRNCST